MANLANKLVIILLIIGHRSFFLLRGVVEWEKLGLKSPVHLQHLLERRPFCLKSKMPSSRR